MTESDKIQLSKQVAKLYGIEATTQEMPWGSLLPLANDSARCFELAVKYELDIKFRFYDGDGFSDFSEIGSYVSVIGWISHEEFFNNYPTKAEATRIAILKCLVKMEESE